MKRISRLHYQDKANITITTPISLQQTTSFLFFLQTLIKLSIEHYIYTLAAANAIIIPTQLAIIKRMAVVISRDFCLSEDVHLTVVRKVVSLTDGNFIVKDDKGNIVFNVIDKLFTLHDRHVLLDARGTPIVTFKKKHLSAHKRWEVFRGESSDAEDLLFSAKTSSIVQFKTELDVFLSENPDRNSWDFKVVGSWLERSCVIYDKNSTPIAQMQKKHTLCNTVLGKDTFGVTVYPQVDYAFVVALVVILHQINKDKHD
ncbi:PREDICTED: protein LURP-one-related 10-like isoform X2 [Erythranthe guttata]|nr:PREDICTED: protein LURP-one-related 10-like isoform X2 [Erythranthe guttata]|eukprot:XP_012838316.1 PREDICTED: protein LURP-one-related 10-like isoform X2 [Erythranthe guttata]